MKRKISILVVAILIGFTEAYSAGRTITGIVTDNSGNPIPGVSVVIKGTSAGAVTDMDGKYTLTIIKEGGGPDIFLYRVYSKGRDYW